MSGFDLLLEDEPPWPVRARAAMDALVRNGGPFTSDDLRRVVGDPDPAGAANARNNAIGSLFAEYSRHKRICRVGVQQSEHPRRKHGVVMVWQAMA